MNPKPLTEPRVDMNKHILLADALAEQRANASPAGRIMYDGMIKHLIDASAVGNALKPGDRAPDFQLASADGRLLSSSEILAKGPAVLSFYRGAWCPYCSAELNALAEIASDIRAAGATLIAITPEAGGMALRTKVGRSLDFDILCDLDNTLALEFGLMFHVPDDVRQAYLARGIDFSKIYGNSSWMLPVPATYIVRRDGVIAHAYVNPDFRYRLEPREILVALADIA
jgi:peroxiredoxin